MATTDKSKTVTLAGATRQCPCHVCAFFSSKEREYEVMLPFLAEGFHQGDKLLNIIDKHDRSERLARLQRAGVDVVGAEQSGQLELRPFEQAHLSTGRFDREAMLELLDQDGMANKGLYRINRCWSAQDWALEDNVSVEEILEYEARFNYLWPNYDGVYVCVYDARKFSAAVMMQMLRTHPHFIIDGVIRENPFYVPPEALLKEIRDKNVGS